MCVNACVSASAHVCGSPRLASSIFLHLFSPNILRQGLLVNLEFAIYAHLGSQVVLGIPCLCLKHCKHTATLPPDFDVGFWCLNCDPHAYMGNSLATELSPLPSQTFLKTIVLILRSLPPSFILFCYFTGFVLPDWVEWPTIDQNLSLLQM